MRDQEKFIDDAIMRFRQVVPESGARSLGILVDPILGDALSDRAADTIAGCRKMGLKIRHPDVPKQQQPYLLWLDDKSSRERLVNLSLRIAIQESTIGQTSPRHSRSICAWLTVEGSAVSKDLRTDVGSHLEQAALLRASGQGWSLFRFYDPRVMERLPEILDSRQLGSLLGPVSSWVLIRRDGRCSALTFPEHDDSEPLQLDARQVSRLGRLGWVNQLLSQAQAWGLKDVTGLPDKLDAALARAQSAGLGTARDCMVFATCALTLHRDFDEHPFFASAIERTRVDGLSFASQVAAISPEQLQMVGKGKWMVSGELEGDSHDA